MDRPLDGKVAIITGAGRASGIGRAAAIELARGGANVVVTDLARSRPETDMLGHSTVASDMTGLEEAVAEIEAAGVRSLAISCDVTDENEVQACVAQTVETFGGVDILFNNAGTPIGAQPFFEIDDRAWELSWRVNVMGMVYFCRAIIPEMRKRGGGSIINNSSIAGRKATPDFAAYTATKFAVIGLTQSLALDFGPDNIRCNAVCPGDIDTKMSAIAVEIGGSDNGSQMGLESIGLRRRGSGQDVGRVVAWLASEESGYVNGAEIPVDGAWALGL